MKIECINISKYFNKICILDNVNLKFESGFIYGLSGRNGCGKSVFFKMICGLYKSTSGVIKLNNKSCVYEKMHELNIRALIEKPTFFNDLTGYENLQQLASIKNEISKETILETLKKVGLYDEKDKLVKKYSLGMKQKLGIAQVLMEDPAIILLDEPFNGLDDTSVIEIGEILKKEKKRGKLIIISTHIKDDLLNLTDKILYFDDKKIIMKDNI